MRLRITAVDDAQTIGRVEQTTPDSLRLVVEDGGQVVLPWSEVVRVERGLGRRGYPERGAIIGSGVMTAYGVGEMVFTDTGKGLQGVGFVLILPLVAAVGAGVGSLVGLAWRSERWDSLPIGVAFATSQSGHGLTFVIRF